MPIRNLHERTIDGFVIPCIAKKRELNSIRLLSTSEVFLKSFPVLLAPGGCRLTCLFSGLKAYYESSLVS